MSRENEPIVLTSPGPVLPGRVSQARAQCGKRNCRCRTDPAKRHGPYYRWTGILEGKSTTVTITKEEAQECARRIRNWKRLQKKLALLVTQALARAPWNER
jgi:hypothetical protein